MCIGLAAGNVPEAVGNDKSAEENERLRATDPHGSFGKPHPELLAHDEDPHGHEVR